jgi:hypothetical protein
MEVRWRAAHAAFGAPVIEPDKGSLMGKEVGVQTRCSSVEGAGQLRRRRRVNACLNELGLMAHAPAGGDLTGDRDIGVPCKPPTGCIRSAVGIASQYGAQFEKLEAQGPALDAPALGDSIALENQLLTAAWAQMPTRPRTSARSPSKGGCVPRSFPRQVTWPACSNPKYWRTGNRSRRTAELPDPQRRLAWRRCRSSS